MRGGRVDHDACPEPPRRCRHVQGNVSGHVPVAGERTGREAGSRGIPHLHPVGAEGAPVGATEVPGHEGTSAAGAGRAYGAPPPAGSWCRRWSGSRSATASGPGSSGRAGRGPRCRPRPWHAGMATAESWRAPTRRRSRAGASAGLHRCAQRGFLDPRHGATGSRREAHGDRHGFLVVEQQRWRRSTTPRR